ncbi:MAG: hypothetical protein KF902_07410 [Phycisphaeraceae bacterium]|nr:hypothetical protein [Phycisphaeraceae bacterium]
MSFEQSRLVQQRVHGTSDPPSKARCPLAVVAEQVCALGELIDKCATSEWEPVVVFVVPVEQLLIQAETELNERLNDLVCLIFTPWVHAAPDQVQVVSGERKGDNGLRAEVNEERSDLIAKERLGVVVRDEVIKQLSDISDVFGDVVAQRVSHVSSPP